MPFCRGAYATATGDTVGKGNIFMVSPKKKQGGLSSGPSDAIVQHDDRDAPGYQSI